MAGEGRWDCNLVCFCNLMCPRGTLNLLELNAAAGTHNMSLHPPRIAAWVSLCHYTCRTVAGNGLQDAKRSLCSSCWCLIRDAGVGQHCCCGHDSRRGAAQPLHVGPGGRYVWVPKPSDAPYGPILLCCAMLCCAVWGRLACAYNKCVCASKGRVVECC